MLTLDLLYVAPGPTSGMRIVEGSGGRLTFPGVHLRLARLADAGHVARVVVTAPWPIGRQTFYELTDAGRLRVETWTA